MNVVIAGEIPFVEEIMRLCVEAGHDTSAFLVEDFYSAVQSESAFANWSEVDVAIEVHHESAASKHELLLALGDTIPRNALLLTSALTLSTTQAASWVPYQERVVGFGLIPPSSEGGLVEVAMGLNTAESALQRAVEFWESLGQTAVTVKDSAGLVRARVVCCIINEAISALQEGIATPADIDKAMKLGTNYPHGPLAWADYLGLDTVLGVMTGLYNEWSEDRYRPAPLLKQMVAAGRLGQKSGKGFLQLQ